MDNMSISESIRNNFLVPIALKIPSNFIDQMLLSFSFLYKTKLFRYESGIPQVNIDHLLQGIDEIKKLPGNIMECGSNRCGTTSILANYLKSKNIEKKVFALDTFGGFDPEEIRKERRLGLTDYPENSYHYNSFEYVEKKILKLKLNDTIILKKGLFQETLPTIDSDFCMGFIDCDLGESMKYVAETLWPKLVNNGILFFHDYNFDRYQNVKPTVDMFVSEHHNEIKSHYELPGMYYVKKL
jgi:hypothetical protein